MIAAALAEGGLAELIADTPSDVSLTWLTARRSAPVLDALTGAVCVAAAGVLQR